MFCFSHYFIFRTAPLRRGYGNSETLSTQSRKRLVVVWYVGASAGASRCYFRVNLLPLFCCSESFCCRKTFLAFHALGPYLHFTTLCPFKKKKKRYLKTSLFHSQSKTRLVSKMRKGVHVSVCVSLCVKY